MLSVLLTSHFLLLTSFPFPTGANLAAIESQLSSEPENLKLAATYRQDAIALGEYDRAIAFLDRLNARPDAGPHAALSLALAYVDKIPAVNAFRRISLGNKATAALTQSIAREPSDIAYLVRGLVNLHFEKGFFHRTPEGVADLEQALRLAASHVDRKYVAWIYVALGDGYWRLKDRAKAHATWQEGQRRFPDDPRLRARLSSPDPVVNDTINHDLDAGVRVDTSLRDLD